MEMSWCSERGIPHSQLLDWANEDRAKLAAFLMESSERCVSCGTAPWEWEEDHYAYEPLPLQCHGCYLKEIAGEDEKPPGTRITLVPKRRAQQIRDTPKKVPKRRREG
jgi:hypothetical protein